MAKDAKGHGSEKRGGTLGDQIRDAQNRRAEGAAAGMSADALAANALAQGGGPKAVPAPVHSGASGRLSFDQGSANFYALQRARLAARDRDSASTRDEYNRDLKLRSRNGQVGSGMKFRG